jgi:DNA polymerase-3 subunit gamma/tau
MVLKTAGRSGVTMLSGVADDQEVIELSQCFYDGELVRIIGLLQSTMAGFTRSSSRRLDAELCILTMCQPTLSLDPESLNARLTKLEEQLKTGSFLAVPSKMPLPSITPKEPVAKVDCKAPETECHEEPEQQEPLGFWPDLVAAVRKELKPPAFGFFAATPNAPVQGSLKGNQLTLWCSNSFILEMINKPEILDLVSRKATVQLGRQVVVKAADRTGKSEKSEKLEQLLSFGREHPDIINIKE